MPRVLVLKCDTCSKELNGTGYGAIFQEHADGSGFSIAVEYRETPNLITSEVYDRFYHGKGCLLEDIDKKINAIAKQNEMKCRREVYG
jgi:hypothetical protein